MSDSEPNVKVDQLTPEELEVFQRCADKAKLKGALLGAVACGAVYAFHKGRGTTLRFPKLAYSLAFIFPFLYGSVYSPVKCVIKGVMGLEHSPLRDFIKLSIQQNGKCPKTQQEGKCFSPDTPTSKDSSSPSTIFGSVTCGVIYWLKAQGRGPSFIHSSPALAYSAGFFFPFIYGGGSAATCVTKGILSLENSPLADRYREVMKNKRSNKGRVGLISPPQQQEKPPPVRKPTPVPVSPPHDESMQPKRPHFEPKSPEMRSGPTAGSYSYNKERALLETRAEEEEEQLPGDEDQPNAFGGSTDSLSSFSDVQRDQSSNGKKKGRTFEEIREERRRGNSRHRPSYPTDKPAAPSGGTKPRKYNQYGDEIEE